MTEMLILRVVHIVFGVFWAGSIFFLVSFVEPVFRAEGAAGQRVMQRLAGRMTKPMAVSAILTILAGLRMYVLASGGSRSWMMSPHGLALGIGGLVAILAFVVGLTVNKPAAQRMARLGAEIAASGAAPSASQAGEIAALRSRLVGATRLVATLLGITVLTMAVARYLG